MRSLSEPEQHDLLKLARDSIVEAVCRDGLPRYLRNDGVFGERCGVFVTLHVLQRLRGCIGVVDDSEPLGSSIVRCAVSAALSDPRFPRVCSEELPDLLIEISLLSTPAPIRPDEIELGRHGLLVRNGAFRGLLLPQVAIEHHFSVVEFLAETCRKAGLPPMAWQQPETEIQAFTCEILSETSLALRRF
jgi:AmmeMemoRadiSam system protein A